MKHGTPSPASTGAIGATHPQHGRHAHRRTITTDCWINDDGRYTAVGWLHDEKGIEALTYALKIVPVGGTMHDMRVTVELSPKLVIEKIAVEMRGVPGPSCPEIESGYDKLIGISVARGFTRALFERVGGVRGCVHVTTLLMQMAPAIMQAYISADALRGYEPERWAALEGTCHIFRPDGPGFARIDEYARIRPSRSRDESEPPAGA